MKGEIDQLLLLRCADKREIVVFEAKIYILQSSQKNMFPGCPRVGVPKQLQSSPDTI